MNPGQLFSGIAAGVQIKRSASIADQLVEFKTGMSFSFLKWLRNIGRQHLFDDVYEWDFSFSLGRSEVYTPRLVADGEIFYILELAVTTTTKFLIISKFKDMSRPYKIRVRFGQPEFKYKEIL